MLKKSQHNTGNDRLEAVLKYDKLRREGPADRGLATWMAEYVTEDGVRVAVNFNRTQWADQAYKRHT